MEGETAWETCTYRYGGKGLYNRELTLLMMIDDRVMTQQFWVVLSIEWDFHSCAPYSGLLAYYW